MTNMVKAIAWGVSRLLNVRGETSVVHSDLEHAHWDRAERRWFTHGGDDPTADQAA